MRSCWQLRPHAHRGCIMLSIRLAVRTRPPLRYCGGVPGRDAPAIAEHERRVCAHIERVEEEMARRKKLDHPPTPLH